MLYLLVGHVSDQTQIWWFKLCISCEHHGTQRLQCHKTNSQRPPSQKASWRQRRAKSLEWNSWVEVCFIFWSFYTCCFTDWALPLKQQAQEPAPLWIQRDYMDRLDLFIITNRTKEVSSHRSEASSVNQCFSQSWNSTVMSMTEQQELPKVPHCEWHETESNLHVLSKCLTWCLYET